LIETPTAFIHWSLWKAHSKYSAGLLAALLSISIVCTFDARSDEIDQNVSISADYPLMSLLDGKSFSGKLEGPGIDPGSTDTVVFKDGKFVSEECQKRCGYTDGPYWIRSNGDGLQFKAETPCLDADATIVWDGIVKGDDIEGTFTWTSERWYWTVKKEFSFRGKLTKPDASIQE
jgi:hypothetical protein